MLPKSPLQQLIPQRLIELESRLSAAIWSPVDLASGIQMSKPRDSFIGYAEARQSKLKRIRGFPFVWGQKWQQAWFRLELPMRALREGLYILWDDEGEATLYADGLPWFGFDAAHHRAPLPPSAREIWVEGTCARTGVWLNDGKALGEEGSVHRGLSLWKKNETAWEVYWDFKVLLDLLEFEYRRHLTSEDDWGRGNGLHQPIFRVSSLFRQILQSLDAFADRFDHDGLKTAPLLKDIYRRFPAGPDALEGILTGHAHIDLVWLWPERIGESKAVHTFSTALRLMERYPEYRFGYSQPASYEAVERRSPELMRAVKRKIQSGQWEATGAGDVECDTQLPCGEALARGLLIGQERFKSLRGESSRVLWLPDVFGYSPCLPQILKQVGVSWFFTTKLTWGTIHRFPYSSFRWAGHDGSEVLVHVSQEVGYNGAIDLGELKKMEECQQEAGIHNEFLVPTGFGDGGGGVTEEILERARRVRDLCGMPRCSWGGIEAFFERMEGHRAQLPQWQGELYLEYHRGVQTTHGDFKAAFRTAERALQLWEAAQAVNRCGPVSQEPWRRLIFCQFHDSIPGSSIREVYEEQLPELLGIASLAKKEAEKAFGAGGKRAHFNPLAMCRSMVVGPGVQDLGPFECRQKTDTRSTTDSVRATPLSLHNKRIHARFTPSGELASLKVDGVGLALSEPANQLWLYPDHPHKYPAWDIDRGTLGNGKRVLGRSARTIESSSPLQGVLAFRRRLTERSSVVVRYRLEAESGTLGIEWEVDWQDPEMLLKAVFPTHYNGRMARFGAPFGSTLRPQQPGDPRAEAMYEVPGSRWAVVADDGEHEGMSLMTESKYGFTARGGILGLSLVRSALLPDARAHTGIRNLKNPNPYSDLGRWTIRGSITRFHDRLPREEQPAALAEILYQRPIEVAGPSRACPFKGLEGGASLIPVWAQPLANGAFVIRLNETLGRRGTCRVLMEEGARVEIVDLSGHPMPEIRFKDGVLTYEPYALLGLRIS